EIRGRTRQEKKPCSMAEQSTSSERKRVAKCSSRRSSWAPYHLLVWTSTPRLSRTRRFPRGVLTSSSSLATCAVMDYWGPVARGCAWCEDALVGTRSSTCSQSTSVAWALLALLPPPPCVLSPPSPPPPSPSYTGEGERTERRGLPWSGTWLATWR